MLLGLVFGKGNVRTSAMGEGYCSSLSYLFSGFFDSYNQLDAQYTIDGVHLNGQGYLAWKKMIEQEVEK